MGSIAVETYTPCLEKDQGTNTEKWQECSLKKAYYPPKLSIVWDVTTL